MKFLLKAFGLPAYGPPKMVQWLTQTLLDEAMRQEFDEGRVRSALMDLQELLDAGDLTEEEYDRQEDVLMQRLTEIRRMKSVS